MTEVKIAEKPCRVLCPVGKQWPLAHDYWYGTFNLCAECREMEEAAKAPKKP